MGTAENLKAAATGNLSAREARNPYDLLSYQLESRLDEFAKVLGSRANAEAYLRVVKNAVLANPDLLNVDRASLLLAAMRAAQDGLMPDGREAVLNIYNTRTKVGTSWEWVKKAQYLPMVGGLIKLLYSGDDVTYIDAAVWYEKDVFKFTRGDNVSLLHEPYLGEEDPGKIMGAYVVVKLANGETKREVMPRRDIERVRAASKAVDADGNPTGPWKDWYDQQAIKSVIKRVYKQLPKTDRLERAIAHDNEEMHPAMAGQGTVGELTLVHAPQTAQPATAPALEHQPGDVIEPTAQPTGEAVHAGGEQEQQQGESAGQAKPSDEPPKVTYTQLLTRLNKTKDRDVATLVLDEGRSALNAEEQQALADAFNKRFPTQA